MKILHTADWHFGKHLYKHSLLTEMQLFTSWITAYLQTEDIDILLISGDMFDVQNPSNVDKEHYFSFLKAIRALNIITIITGGNHDSINFLNSSKSYLAIDNIYVIGGATAQMEDEVFNFTRKGETITICAIPFLRDNDLRTATKDKDFNSRHEAIQHGLQEHYQECLKIAKQKHPNTPILGMGHLFAIGSSTSESERDIHVGNTGAVSHQIFDGYDYVALGHIHKPQIINKNEMIRYSGSPIPLSFSEKKDTKQVLIVTVKDGQIQPPEVVETPNFRELLRFTGSIQEIKAKIANYTFKENPLPALIEIIVTEELYDIALLQEANNFVSDFNAENDRKILYHRISFNKGCKQISEYYEPGTNIEDLAVTEVFDKLVDAQFQTTDAASKEDLKTTFNELLDIYYNSED